MDFCGLNFVGNIWDDKMTQLNKIYDNAVDNLRESLHIIFF